MKLGRLTICAVSAVALAASLAGCNAKADDAPAKNDTTQSAKNLTEKGGDAKGDAKSGGLSGGGGFGDGNKAPEKLSANDAPEAELAGAFEKAKIPDGAKWAKAVVDNRPYPADDIFIKKLREAMGKDGASEEVQDQVVSVITVEKSAKK